jgi:hypothetical protein
MNRRQIFKFLAALPIVPAALVARARKPLPAPAVDYYIMPPQDLQQWQRDVLPFINANPIPYFAQIETDDHSPTWLPGYWSRDGMPYVVRESDGAHLPIAHSPFKVI